MCNLAQKVEQYRQILAAERPEIVYMPQEQVVSIMLADKNLNSTVKKALTIYDDYTQRLNANGGLMQRGGRKVSIFPTYEERQQELVYSHFNKPLMPVNLDEVEDAPLFGELTPEQRQWQKEQRQLERQSEEEERQLEEKIRIKKYGFIIEDAKSSVDNAEKAVDTIYKESGWTGRTGEFLSKYNLFSPVRSVWNYFADDEQKSVITGESYGRTKGKYHWDCTTSDSIKEEIAKAREKVAALEKAAKKGDAAFKREFFDFYHKDYDEKAIHKFKKTKNAYIEAVQIHQNKKNFDEKVQAFLDAPVPSKNARYKGKAYQNQVVKPYNEYIQTLATTLPNGEEDIQTILKLNGGEDAPISKKWQILHEWAKQTQSDIEHKLNVAMADVKQGATTIEDCQSEYNKAYEKAFGSDNKFQRELERYSSLQSYRSGVTKTALITAGTIASGGLGTAGAGAAGLGTTATTAVSTGAAGVGAALSTGTIEATDQASAGKEVQWSEIAKASAVNGVITIAMGGTNHVLTNVMTKAGMGALSQAGTRMAANIGMGAGVEKIMTGEITKDGMVFVVTLSVIGEVMTIKSIQSKTPAGEVAKHRGVSLGERRIKLGNTSINIGDLSTDPKFMKVANKIKNIKSTGEQRLHDITNLFLEYNGYPKNSVQLNIVKKEGGAIASYNRLNNTLTVDESFTSLNRPISNEEIASVIWHELTHMNNGAKLIKTIGVDEYLSTEFTREFKPKLQNLEIRKHYIEEIRKEIPNFPENATDNDIYQVFQKGFSKELKPLVKHADISDKQYIQHLVDEYRKNTYSTSAKSSKPTILEIATKDYAYHNSPDEIMAYMREIELEHIFSGKPSKTAATEAQARRYTKAARELANQKAKELFNKSDISQLTESELHILDTKLNEAVGNYAELVKTLKELTKEGILPYSSSEFEHIFQANYDKVDDYIRFKLLDGKNHSITTQLRNFLK